MRVLAANNYPDPNSRYSNNGPRPAPTTRFMTIIGQPKTIALQFSTGKPVRSRINGAEQMMYTLTSGERAYFDLHVAQAIDSLTLAPGEPFTVCHHGGGNWDIERAAPDAMLPQSSPLPPPAPQHHQQQPPPQIMNGNGEDLAAILTRAYAQAIEITAGAMEAARARGLQVLPSHEGLQACAATLFIAETRRQQ